MINTRISVRNLIEFILRAGDIDNRIGTFSDDAMQEGARIHRQLQSRAGADYNAEVSLAYTYVEEDVEITVEGRADGVIENESGVTIDEIKTTYADVMRYSDAKPLHLAQAKFYAYIVAEQQDLPVIKVRLTYVNIETEEIRYFNYNFLKEELLEFTSKVCHEYVKWARLEQEWIETRNKSINGLPFPFEYRDGQDELVKQVYYTIYHKKKLFLEAPTGVGKTISTMYPAIQAMGQNMGSKLFYLTAKTITRTVAEETIEIMRKENLKFRNITLTAKEKICFTEEHECNPDACPYAKGHFDRVNDCVYELVTKEEAITASKIREYAEKYQVCPFEMSLDASLFADGIICDYNYAFDPSAKLKRFFEDESRSGNYLFLIDEAHNLVDRAREMYSATLYKEQFLAMKKIVEEDFPKLSKRFEKCNKELLKLKHECDDYLINPMIGEFTVALTRAYADIEKILKDERKPSEKKKIPKDVKDAILEIYFEMGHFLNMYEIVDENYCVYATYDEHEDFFVKLFCVNPRNNLKECMQAARATVLFSATLLPIQYYKNLLAGEHSDYEVYADSIFDPSKRGLFLASDVTSKYTRRSDSEYLKIARYIHEVVNAKAGNYMVFFPSYNFLEQVYYAYRAEYYDEENVEFIVQSSKMTEEEKELFLKRFEGNEGGTGIGEGNTGGDVIGAGDAGGNCISVGNVIGNDIFAGIEAEIDIEDDSSLVGFCVMGGIFSEGIDLTAESLIGAIIVGTGLPQVCLEREIMKNTFETEDVDGFDYAYRYPGMNKVLQAAGRVIRTESDIGIVVLLDERFLQRSYIRMFPKEWEEYKRVNIGNVSNEIIGFWEEYM